MRSDRHIAAGGTAAADDTQLRDYHRLHRHLGQSGAFATASPLGCGRLALFRTDRQGTTLGAGHVVAQAASALVADGHAAWAGEGAGKRLEAIAASVPATALSSRVMVVDGVAQTVIVDDRESPLLWLHRRMGRDGKPQISDAQFAAGERFRSDLTRAQLLPRTTMNWDVSLACGVDNGAAREPASASDSALAARQRVRRACDRLGPDLSGLAIDVCGFLKGLELVERERRWPSRSAKVVLRLALTQLAAHYGIDAPGAPAPSGRGTALMRAEGSRAHIGPAPSRI